jgi:glycosyltransferase involved in cell wall biosynthesis
MELVSIITPLFNRAHLLLETWESVRHQTYSDWEWIVVDDGSTDDSMQVMNEITQSDKRVKLFIRPPELPKGPSACRNHGAAMARGNYFIFLDSDDVLSSDCLRQRVSVMVSNGELDFAVFPMLYFQRVPGDSDKIFNRFLETSEEYLKYFLTDRPPWQTMCPIWKASSFLQLGGFKENYIFMEDPELHVRAIVSNYSFQVINAKPDCFYRDSFHENQSQHLFWRRSIEGRIAFLKDMYEYLNNKVGRESRRRLLMTYLSHFYFSITKGFILARLHTYKNEFSEITEWVKEKQIISTIQYLKMKFAYRIYLSESKWITFLHLRGITYRFL